jgi:phospholipase/carboxylesterase
VTSHKADFDYVARGPEKARRLVVLLHGYGRNPAFMEKVADAILADLPDTRIVMPWAPDPMNRPGDESGNLLHVPADVREADGQAERQWFDIQGGAQELRSRVVKIATRMNQFIDNQRDIMGIDDHDIAIMGFSQGGGVALYTALMRAQTVRCVVAHSTIFLGDTTFRSRPPVLMLRGLADPEFPVSMFETAEKAIGQYTDSLTLRTVPGLGHSTNRDSREIVAHYIRDAFRPR